MFWSEDTKVWTRKTPSCDQADRWKALSTARTRQVYCPSGSGVVKTLLVECPTLPSAAGPMPEKTRSAPRLLPTRRS